MKMLAVRLWIFALACCAISCGDNQEVTNPGQSFGPPTGLKAVSAGKASVRLSWNAAPGTTDSTFSGYVIAWGSRRDSVAKSVLSYLADSLSRGEILFTVYSRRVNGPVSDGAQIRWAAADRFDDPLTLVEFKAQSNGMDAGLHIGSFSTDPSTVQVVPGEQDTLDVFLYGGIGGYAEALELRSAGQYAAGWHATKFSTVTALAANLDYALDAFPPSGTFTLDSAPVVDNTIYYVKVMGDNQSINYARVHVHIKPGTQFPSRAIDVRISLQRVAGLLYAHAVRGPIHAAHGNVALIPFLP